MRKVLFCIFACCIGIGVADAAVRNASSVSREGTTKTISNIRATNPTGIVSRSVTNQNVKARAARPTAVARTTASQSRTPATARTTTARTSVTQNTVPTITATRSRALSDKSVRTTTINTSNSQTFGVGYNTCRDAYFTCMDQFCATQNENYRRCVCSSRLTEIRDKQNALSQSADQLQDFKDLNIESISKTAAEVKAMQTASDGEAIASYMKDKSSSIAQLAGISAVLSNTKSKSLSTAGQLDIAGDINAIWATTDLASGLNISNLTGETLYSAVHSQCVNLVADRCSSKSLLNMVVSAYSMYIENDCSLLSNALNKQKTLADASIRETEREMNTTRLENYDAHNSSSINDCIALVRRDVTSDNACGSDYIHCLDITGLYLNKTTGEPIYTSNFYQLGSMLSLSGDILTNQTNRFLVTELNRKKIFAKTSLDTCRDLADEVWDEFMRQAITEIYQGQQTRIRDVKNECLDVVNQCYDTQSNSLKDFSNINEQLLLGARLELSEELCREKLEACSNLYGGGPNGMTELVTTMTDITTQKIAQNCFATLQNYAQQLCAVPSTDFLHSYPYGCRAYAPGNQQDSLTWYCNIQRLTQSSKSSFLQASGGTTGSGFAQCKLQYTKCKEWYYMVDEDGKIIDTPKPGNRCIPCPQTGCPNTEGNITPRCEEDYIGSLYQKLVQYAVQSCLHPSAIEAIYSQETGNIAWSQYNATILQDVNATMDIIKSSMASVLKTECERLDGYWVSTPYDGESAVNTTFYTETGANKKWGYCKSEP